MAQQGNSNDRDNLSSDRALGTLLGGAIGDAMGMPSQTLDRVTIEKIYGQITDFVAPCDDHPVSHGLQAADITDDTEQTILLAQLLLEQPDRFNEKKWAQMLVDWEDDVRKRGLRDLLGPSTKVALNALLAGANPEKTGINGNTNGAAMRISPVAIATPLQPLQTLVDQVEKSCRITHNTAEAISAAAAVAAAISAGIEGADYQGATDAAIKAAQIGSERGHRRGEVDIAKRIEEAVEAVANQSESAALDIIADKIGTRVICRESIAASFAILHVAKGDAWQAAKLSANIGEDTDTVGAISCAIAASCSGMQALPEKVVSRIRQQNQLPLEGLAEGLLSLRHRHLHVSGH